MVELIIVIAIIAYVCKKAGIALNESSKVEVLDKRKENWGAGTYQAPKQATRQTSPRVQVQENIAKARQLATDKLREIEKEVVTELNKPATRSAMQQVHEGRMEARNTTIVERAKANSAANKADVTLETMEAEHNHSERVSAAVHHHPEDVMPESMLGNIEDLMIKGYDGNLCFERDFVGEGLDMISRFTI